MGKSWKKVVVLLKLIVTGTPIGKRSLGRPRRRWEDIIIHKM